MKLFLGCTREVLECMKKITMKMKDNSIYTVEMNKGIHMYIINNILLFCRVYEEGWYEDERQ